MRLRPLQAGDSKSRRFEARLALAGYALLNALIATVRKILWPGALPANAANVCVYRTGNVGDIVCAYPALLAVRRRFPEARLVLLTSPGRKGAPGARDVFAGIDWIDEILEYFPDEISGRHNARAFLARLKGYRFDVFIELPNDVSTMKLLFRNMAFAKLIGSRWAAGWRFNTLPFALRQQSEFIDFPEETERLTRLVAALGFPEDPANSNLPLREVDRLNADAILQRAGVPPDAPLIALAYSAKRPGNRWPWERFAQVGRELTKAGYYVLLMGTKAESDVAESIRAVVGERCISLAGATDIPTAAAVIKRCRLAICNDSGLQHIASSVGTPCVAIFSFYFLRGKWFPHHPQSVVLQKPVPCHTCYLQTCPIGDRCVTDTTPEEVLSAALGILN